MPKGFDLRGGPGRTARVWLQPKGGAFTSAKRFVLLPAIERREDRRSLCWISSTTTLALIAENTGHVNFVVCEAGR